jgi:hypothetical protein
MGWRVAQSLVTLFLISAFSGYLSTQEPSIRAGIVQVTGGEVLLDGNPLQLKNIVRVIYTGQRISTKRGLVELILDSNINVSLGENASLRMDQGHPNVEGLTLEKGFILIEVAQKLTRPIRVRISNSTVVISKPGLYRLDSSLCDLRVYNGTALADNGFKKAQVKSKRKIHLAGDLSQTKFDPKASDALHQWSARRSFDIFLANPTTDNWKWRGIMPSAQNPNPVGFFENSSYQVRFKAQMPPQYARRFGLMQAIDLDRTAQDAKDRLKREEDLQRAQQIREMLEKIEKEPPHP